MTCATWLSRSSVVAGAVALVIAGLVWVAYGSVLDVGFVADDFAGVLLARRTPWTKLFEVVPGFRHYAPGAITFWKAGDLLSGGDTRIWHALLLVLAWACALLTARLLKLLGASEAVAVLSALLFVGFIYLPEVVAWTTIGFHLLAYALYLGAVVAYATAWERGWGWRVVVLVLGASAMLTYETALALPASLLLVDHGRGCLRGNRRTWTASAATSGLVLCYMWLARSATREIDLLLGPLGVAKKAGIGLAHASCLNQPFLLDLYFASWPVRVVSTVGLLGAWGWMLWRGPRLWRVLAVWVGLHLLPTLPLSAHHPRYFLFPSLGMVGLWSCWIVAAVDALPWRGGEAWRRALLAVSTGLLLAGGFVHVQDRLADWQEATRAVESLRQLLKSNMHEGTQRLILIDLPERSAPFDDVRPPAYMFLSAFNDAALLRLTGSGLVPPRVELRRLRPLDPRRPVVATGAIDPGALQYLRGPGTLVVTFDYDQRTARLVPSE